MAEQMVRHRPLASMVVLTVAAYVGLRTRFSVRLAADAVVVDGTPDEIVNRFRGRMGDGPDVLAAQPERVVRRFRGRAGRFRYETIELVTFESAAITFDHLAGPFLRCHEAFSVVAVGGGRSRVTHSGTFVLRGGIWTWPLARTAVKRAFELHVHEHLLALRDELASTT